MGTGEAPGAWGCSGAGLVLRIQQRDCLLSSALCVLSRAQMWGQAVKMSALLKRRCTSLSETCFCFLEALSHAEHSHATRLCCEHHVGGAWCLSSICPSRRGHVLCVAGSMVFPVPGCCGRTLTACALSTLSTNRGLSLGSPPWPASPETSEGKPSRQAITLLSSLPSAWGTTFVWCKLGRNLKES